MIKKKVSVSKKSSKEKVKTKVAPKVKTVSKTKKSPSPKKKVDLVSDSLDLAKTLNKEIAKVGDVKDSLKRDLKKLSLRVDAHEKKAKASSSSPSSIHSNFLSTIKDEIINEFTPLINKLDLKSVKLDIFNEIKKIIEVESQKLKSELDFKSSKSKKEFSKRLSDLEIRIIDSFNANNSIKKELKKLEEKNFKGLSDELEEKIHISIKKINDKFFTLFSSSTIDIDELKVNTQTLAKKLESLKKQVKKNFTIEDLDLSSIESKIKKLEIENTSLKSLIERFENELFNRKKSETFEVEKRVQKNLTKTEEKLKEFSGIKDTYEKLLVTKFNEIADFVSGIEKKITKLEKTDLTKIEKKTKETLSKELVFAEEKLKNLFLKKQKDLDFNLQKFEQEISTLTTNATTNLESSYIKIDREREMLLEDVMKSKEDLTSKLNDKFNDMSIKFDLKLNPVLKNLNKDKNLYRDEIDGFKNEISTLVKNYVSEIDKELKILKSSDTNFKKDKKEAFKDIDSRFVKQIEDFSNDYNNFIKDVSTSIKTLEKEKGLERDFIANKFNEVVDKFEDLNRQNNEILKDEKIRLEQEVKDEISKQILNDTNHLNKITQENKEELVNLKESIEIKFLAAKEQFESSFITKLMDFDNELKSKEGEFLEKLSIIEVDKNKMVEELGEFKDEITTLTKTYVNNLDQELQKIKIEEAKFDREVEEFGIHVQDIVKARKLELLDYSKKLEDNLFEVLKSQKENFDKNENSFRATFNEKISNLKDYTQTRLDSIEKKFIDKNLKYVTTKLEAGMADLNVFNERIKTREAEINAKFEEFETYQQNSFVEMKAEKDKIDEDIEERVMGLEQKFNKRFLDYGSEISSFKGVVIDEVEGLIREVNTVLANKVEQIDNSFAKTNFINNEIKVSFNKIKELDNKVESELMGIRDDVSDVRVKLELIDGVFSHTINDHVQYMSEYEDQLVALIDTLKLKGIEDSQIRVALINKGHPRFYVSMILENYSKLLN